MDLGNTFKEIGVGTSVGGFRGLGIQNAALQAWKPKTLGDSIAKSWGVPGTGVQRRALGVENGFKSALQQHSAIHKNMLGALESQKFLKNSLTAAAPWAQLKKDLTGFQSLASTLNENLGFHSQLKSMMNSSFKAPSLYTASPLVGLQRNATKSALWDLVERDKQQGLRWFGGELSQRSSLSTLAREGALDYDLVSQAEADVLFQEQDDSTLKFVLDSVLDDAQAFEDQFGGTEVEENANQFLDSRADVAAQITNSPYLVTLTFKQRRLLARYLTVVVYIVFVSIAIYGYAKFPVYVDILALLGVSLGHKSVASKTYKYSLKALDRYLADPDEG